MYKLLLCWRYLRTRYLALVCIASVMLGVATLIVVNSVMGGFSTKLKERLHGLLSDVVIETQDMGGFRDPEGKMAQIRSDPFLNEHIVAMAPTLEVFAILSLPGNHSYARPVRLIGIDPESRSRIGGFQEFLVNPDHRQDPKRAFEMDDAARQRFFDNQNQDWAWQLQMEQGVDVNPPAPGAKVEDIPPLPPGLPPIPAGPAKPPPAPPPRQLHQPQGAVIGVAIATYRKPA